MDVSVKKRKSVDKRKDKRKNKKDDLNIRQEEDDSRWDSMIERQKRENPVSEMDKIVDQQRTEMDDFHRFGIHKHGRDICEANMGECVDTVVGIFKFLNF